MEASGVCGVGMGSLPVNIIVCISTSRTFGILLFLQSFGWRVPDCARTVIVNDGCYGELLVLQTGDANHSILIAAQTPKASIRKVDFKEGILDWRSIQLM